ncbi:MAG: sigma-70 family RNA polymerase sigma factor [Planctomycetales bacterium]|nr:sigma-70 family RNA polymerase sigma factor [Planctomycetales bacterium]
MTDITTILSKIDQGDPAASERLLPLVYDELRRLAAARMARENPGQTLQATALVHEAYVRLIDGENGNQWDSRGHFFAAAAEAMRRILIDRARAKNRPKHGGDRQRMELEIHCPAGNESPDRLLAINEALEKLQDEHPHVAELLKLRYFAGVPLKDAAELLGISPATAKRRWAFARAFLYGELAD